MKRALFATLLFLVAVGHASMQTPTAADGPWAGWAQCALTGQFANQGQTYRHQQTHTWELTSSTPGPGSSSAIKQYAATWQVTGQGSRQRGQGSGQGNNEQWTTAGQPMADTITIRLTAGNTIRIGGAAQLRSVGATTGAALPDIDEWAFPMIEGAGTQTTISGSAPQGLLANFPGAPPGTSSTVTCSWHFVRGGGTPPPPPGRDTRDPTRPAGSLAGLNLPGASVAAGPAPAPITGAPAPLATASAGPTYKDPDGFTAIQTGDGTVQLKWNAVTGVSNYMLGGPGTNNGVQVTGTTHTVNGISAGLQTWTVASLPVVTPSDKWPRATVTIVNQSGKYRISIAGFRVNHPTYDDQLSFDGRGDEVYAAATVTKWVRALNSVVVTNETVKSDVYGDANRSGTVQAGVAGARGGLTSGDFAPSGWHPSMAPSGTDSRTRFPLLLWEGTLTDADVVVIHPTLWEVDGDNTTFEYWKSQTSGRAASNYFWFKDMNGAGIFAHTDDFPTRIYQYSTAAQFANADEPFTSSSTRPERIYPGRDRPIGLDYYVEDVLIGIYNYSRIYWVDREYTFTRAKIEGALNTPAAGLAAGIIAIPFVDGDPHHVAGRLEGDYTMYFRVQRVP